MDHSTTIVIWIVLICITVGTFYYFSRRSHVPGNRDSADAVREQLESVERKQSEASSTIESVTDGLKSSEGVVSRIEESVDRVSETIDSSKRIVDDSQRRIEQSEAIISDIRRTAPKN